MFDNEGVDTFSQIRAQKMFSKLCQIAINTCEVHFYTSWHTTSSYLPEDEAEAIHICHDVWLKMTSVQCLIQNLWRHVALCTHSGIGRDVYLICVTAESEMLSLLTGNKCSTPLAK